MALSVLCSDSKCSQRKSCLRYIVDPKGELLANRKVRIEDSLRVRFDRECKSYRPVNLTHPEEIAL